MQPTFSAISNDAYQLYTLLRCIGFAEKARVQITPDGIRFSVEESRVMQGLVFLDKALFTTYTFQSNPSAEPGHQDNDDGPEEPAVDLYPQFLISLTALLETLQIFGIGDANLASSFSNNSMQSTTAGAFASPTSLLGRSCTLSYLTIGSPLCITLSESGVTTTCELTTYEWDDPSFGSTAGEVDIPLQRDAIIMKIIMRSTWLHNAINELDATNPTVLTISASSRNTPFLTLSGSGGPYSESSVTFSTDKENTESDAKYPSLPNGASFSKRAKPAPTVTETFQVNPPSSTGSLVKESYRFALLRKASRAMAAATKVSIRGDIQGVLSLQFMIELGDNGGGAGDVGLGGGGYSRNVSFVDFRFVPLVGQEDGDEGEGDDVENSETW